MNSYSNFEKFTEQQIEHKRSVSSVTDPTNFFFLKQTSAFIFSSDSYKDLIILGLRIYFATHCIFSKTPLSIAQIPTDTAVSSILGTTDFFYWYYSFDINIVFLSSFIWYIYEITRVLSAFFQFFFDWQFYFLCKYWMEIDFYKMSWSLLTIFLE